MKLKEWLLGFLDEFIGESCLYVTSNTYFSIEEFMLKNSIVTAVAGTLFQGNISKMKVMVKIHSYHWTLHRWIKPSYQLGNSPAVWIGLFPDVCNFTSVIWTNEARQHAIERGITITHVCRKPNLESPFHVGWSCKSERQNVGQHSQMVVRLCLQHLCG